MHYDHHTHAIHNNSDPSVCKISRFLRLGRNGEMSHYVSSLQIAQPWLSSVCANTNRPCSTYVYRMEYLPLFHMNVVQKVFCMFPEHCCQLTPIVRLVMHYWLLASATLTQRSLRICGEHTAARVCVFIRARKPRHCRFSVGEREAEVIAFLPAGHSPYEERALEGMAAMDETTPSSSCSCIVKSCNERLSLRA